MKKLFMILTGAFMMAASAGFAQVAVDLGLPSGTKWADRNVGASSPTAYGDYFAWGETQSKVSYGQGTYKYYNASSKEYVNIGDDIAGTRYDVARAKWGGSWRMPTKAQFKELVDKCKREWTTVNGVKGYRFTGPNGKSIFLPAAGYRYGTSLDDTGSGGYYWSGTLTGDDPSIAYYLNFYSGGVYVYYYYFRFNGLSVRPVRP